MIFSRATFRNLKHKTKKGLMLKIGQTESQPEDPNFKQLLSVLNDVKQQLREMYSTFRSVVASGKQYNEKLEMFCGFGLRSEEVFNKEAEFINTLDDRVCNALGRIVNKDIKTMDEVVVQYKTAKLNFDALHFKTVKQMRKKGKNVTVEQADEVMLANVDLPALNEAYIAAKENIRSQREVLLTHLKTKIESRLDELREISKAQHHQLYCRYFKERVVKTIETLSWEPSEDVNNLTRSNTFSFHRSNPTAIMRKFKSVAGAPEAANSAGNQGSRPLPINNGQKIENENVAGHQLNLALVTKSTNANLNETRVSDKHQQILAENGQVPNEA